MRFKLQIIRTYSKLKKEENTLITLNIYIIYCKNKKKKKYEKRKKNKLKKDKLNNSER